VGVYRINNNSEIWGRYQKHRFLKDVNFYKYLFSQYVSNRICKIFEIHITTPTYVCEPLLLCVFVVVLKAGYICMFSLRFNDFNDSRDGRADVCKIRNHKTLI